MRLTHVITAGILSGGFIADTLADASAWSEFRGSAHDGTSEATGLPLTWSETENIKWKIALPGAGHSSPVVADGRIWLTHSPDEGKARHVLCVDFETGEILKDIKLFTHDPTDEMNHKMNSYATPTPIAQGNRVYVTFGNPGTACLDAGTGEPVWVRRDITNQYFDVGAASCPILYGNKIILTSDGQPDAARFVTALDKDTGKTLWRTERTFKDDKIPSYSHSSCTPLVVTVNGKEQVVSPGASGVRGYDLETGEELWVARYEAWSVVPRPVAAGNLVIICAGVVKEVMMAIRLDKAKGDITDTDAIAWSTTNKRLIPDMPSPLLINNRLYTMTSTTLRCVEPSTGEVIWSNNIPGQHLASPVSADGRIYLFNSNGGATVVALGDTFEQLASNKLDAGCYASPAIAGKSIIIRTGTHLYRIAK